ncbi:MAG: S8 family serine peptidase [Kofleriaceae bacterium]
MKLPATLCILGTVMATGSAGCVDDSAPAALPARSALAPLGTVPAGHRIDGRYIVVLRDDVARLTGDDVVTGRAALPLPQEVAGELAAELPLAVVATFDTVLRGFAVDADATTLERLRADPRVAWVDEDQQGQPAAVQTNPGWGLDRIDQRTKVGDASFYYGTPTPPPHLYVIDSGIRWLHQEFVDRRGEGKGFDGNDPWEDHDLFNASGHGTAVASIAGGTTSGVSKNAVLHSVRITDASGASSSARVIQAMDWIAANRVGVAVANLSWDFDPVASIDAAATSLITTAGVPLVVAAGNDGLDACGHSPQRVAATIVVGATDATDTRWASSRFGACVDVFAPGVAVTTASATSDTATSVRTGTSFAAPYVAGALAQYYADKPGYTPAAMACEAFGSGCQSPGAATAGVISNVGAGSPNKLLWSPGQPAGSPPTITRLSCPVPGSAGGSQYSCQVTYTSSVPALVTWPGGATGSFVTRTCAPGSIVSVTVTVTNAYGSSTRTSASFSCPTGPVP